MVEKRYVWAVDSKDTEHLSELTARDICEDFPAICATREVADRLAAEMRGDYDAECAGALGSEEWEEILGEGGEVCEWVTDTGFAVRVTRLPLIE